MTATLDALKSGEILASHAKVIAREAPKKQRRSEEDFLELCRAYPCDTVARHTFAVGIDVDGSMSGDVEPTQTQLTADAISDLIAGTSTARLLILAARDGGCIGCELTSDHTQAHHIDYFENGGLTEVPNLASMCWDCHTNLHQHDRKIHTPPDGHPRLLPPTPNSTGPPARAPATARSP